MPQLGEIIQTRGKESGKPIQVRATELHPGDEIVAWRSLCNTYAGVMPYRLWDSCRDAQRELLTKNGAASHFTPIEDQQRIRDLSAENERLKTALLIIGNLTHNVKRLEEICDQYGSRIFATVAADLRMIKEAAEAALKTQFPESS